MSACISSEPRAAEPLLRRHLADAAHLLALGDAGSASHLIEYVLDLSDAYPALDRAVTAQAIALLRHLDEWRCVAEPAGS